MAAAAGEVGQRHRRLLLVGVDSPDLPAGHLVDAAELTGHVQVSLGPTADGGYWFLGLQNRVDASALLRKIAWSSGREATQTLVAAHSLRYTAALGPAWDDVDCPEDLVRLVSRIEQSDHPCDRALRREIGRALAGVS
jgi:glycosyltransferase A (GT-A) superfamily protein (DUF2064 family)